MLHPLSALVARTTRAVTSAPPTDGALLLRFVRTRDEAAFAELVARLGPLVLGACRRVARDPHAAEDAFQAAFLVLARRAGDVRPAEGVRGWLYGVAVRTAQEARKVNARRRQRETPVPHVPDRAAEATEPPDADALAALDEAIAALPDHLRSAVALCELDGLSRRDAAGRLGIAEGTLSSRLAKARKLLAERLRARGFALPTVGLAALAPAAVSARLTARTAALAAPGAAVPATVAALTKGVFRTMLAQKLKAAFPLAVGVLTALTCAALAADRESAARPPAVQAARGAAPVPKAAPREGVLLITALRPAPSIDLRTPAGDELPTPALGGALAPINPGDPPTCTLVEGRLSPDGTRVAAFKLSLVNDGAPWTRMQLWVFDRDAKDGPREPLLPDLRYPSVVFSPDGAKLFGSQVDPEKVADARKDEEPIPLVSWVLDLKAKKRTPLALPPGHGVADVSPDGKTLLTVERRLRGSPWARSYLVPLDTLKPRPLTDKALCGQRFSPDGKRVLGTRYDEPVNGRPSQVLVSVSVADGTEKVIPLPAGAAELHRACWSPDGRRVAFHWHEEVPPAPANGNAPKDRVCRVTVSDLDGRNAKTFTRREDTNVTGLDWR